MMGEVDRNAPGGKWAEESLGALDRLADTNETEKHQVIVETAQFTVMLAIWEALVSLGNDVRHLTDAVDVIARNP